jgi:ClpP class serine protease
MKTIEPTIGQLRMLASIRGQQWMIRPDMIQAYALAALDVPEKANALNITIEDFYEMRPPATMDADGIAHVWIHAALVDSCPTIYEKLGLCTRYTTIIAEVNAAVEQGAKGILFHVDSPGGTVSGCIEAAKAIAGLPIPSITHCHGLACSAAYKLSAGCNRIFANESATVGNIGSIMSWMDCTEFWRDNGIEFKALVSDGADLKSTFHLEPNEVQLAFLQESINESGKKFRDHVIAGRSKAGVTMDDEVWRAGWYSGNRAGELGLIDDMGTAEDARQELLSLTQ